MRSTKSTSAVALLLLTFLALPAEAFIRSPAPTFATLPAGAAHPEGITVDAAGNVYVTLFAVGATPPGQLIVFDSSGRLLRQVVQLLEGRGSGEMVMSPRITNPRDALTN